MTTSYVNNIKINRIERAKQLVGKEVTVKGSDRVYLVTGRTSNGYVYLDNDSKQDVIVLREVKKYD